MPVIAGTFYQLSIETKGTSISASINGVQVASVVDSSSAYGMAAIGSSWTKSWFDQFSVKNGTGVVGAI